MKHFSLDNQSDGQQVLNQIVLEYLREQNRQRRWRWIFRGLIACLILGAVYWNDRGMDDFAVSKTKPHAGLIDVEGGIFDAESGSADAFMKGLDAAYKSPGLQAMIFRINSPGGSPVQADYMYNAIQYYRHQFPKIKTYAVCVDMCASAAYYIAAGADEIYANPASLVGSIGVLYNGFGFVDGLKKLGVTRRLQTAGVNKAILDPFSPEKPSDQVFLQNLLDDVHQQFIEKVKEGRGDRLKIDDQTFSGLFWTGHQAKERGLIDGFASAGQLVHEKIKLEHVINYTHKESVLDKLAKNMSALANNPLTGALGFSQQALINDGINRLQ